MNIEQFQAWEVHPATQIYMKFLADYRQKIMEDWANGSYNYPSSDATAIRNAEMLGRARMLEELANMAEDCISEFYRNQKEVKA